MEALFTQLEWQHKIGFKERLNIPFLKIEQVLFLIKQKENN